MEHCFVIATAMVMGLEAGRGGGTEGGMPGDVLVTRGRGPLLAFSVKWTVEDGNPYRVVGPTAGEL